MFVLPVIERELSVALRKYRADKSRFKTALIGGLIVLFFLVLNLAAGSAYPSHGKIIHAWLFYVCLYLSIIPPTRICVGLFCEERRNQTLELLYLTGMGSGELFLGKVFGGLLVASNDLLALAPFLAIPFLIGGVSLDLFLATIACFPVALLFVAALGILASVIFRDDGAALAGAVLLGGVACLALPLPYFLGKAVAGTAPFSSRWLCLSPAYGPFLVATNFAGEKPRMFWHAAMLSLALTLICILAAAAILRRTWRGEIVRGHQTAARLNWRTWLYGSQQWRADLRAQLLPLNPFQWLAQQDRWPVTLAWAWIGTIAILWLAGLCGWPRIWPSPANFFITALLLILGVGRTIAYASAQRIGQYRRDGVLELLLTSPLTPAQIVDGQSAAVTAQFRPVRLTLFALFLVMTAGGLLTRTWTAGSITSYLLIWCFFLGWCFVAQKYKAILPMWIALNTGRPTAALLRLRNNAWYWIFMAYNIRTMARGLVFAGSFPSGSPHELFIVILVSSLTAVYYAITAFAPPSDKVRTLLLADMRLIARQPVPDSRDPRFKKWDVRQRLPMKMSEYVGSLPDRASARRAVSS